MINTDADLRSLLLNDESVTFENENLPIEVTSCSVLDLFNCSSQHIPNSTISGLISVPEYQRPYLWNTKEVKKLIIDLQDHFNNNDPTKPMYYLGSIILHQENGKLNIIDGQQRLTTLALIQSALLKDTPEIRYSSPISIFNIQENYKFLTSETNVDRIKNINIAELNVSLIITRNEDDAYTFFETQNTGGVRLTGVDIIKAHHLRDITTKGNQQDQYAQIWENQHGIETVIECLIKARRWGVLNWKPVPSDRDLKGTKISIIEDFSERTLAAKEKSGYQHVCLSENYTKLNMQSSHLAIRQPLANGENFIDYIRVSCELYQRLFLQCDDKDIPDEYYVFDKKIIKAIDGTGFLKEFYEIALICYSNRFGFRNILEASYWIFRYSYSIRISNQKTVREDSIPAFIRNGNYGKGNFLFDHILHSFSHEQLIQKLKSFKYEFNKENLEGNTVKARFIRRLSKYFEGNEVGNEIEKFKKDFDKQLVIKIKGKIDGQNV